MPLELLTAYPLNYFKIWSFDNDGMLQMKKVNMLVRLKKMPGLFKAREFTFEKKPELYY